MTAAKCHRCGRYWSFNVNPIKFDVITKWCPDCIPQVLPVAGSTPVTPPALRIEHGTMRAYRSQGCRCLLCRAANSNYQREYQARKKESA